MHSIAMLLVPGMTQLDFTGPYEVFARCPNVKVHLVWKTMAPVATEYGLSILPTATLDQIHKADVLFVPGGRGTNALLTDTEVLEWVREVAKDARYVTSVCTGALVLGAAGLLRHRKAATHWTAMPMLADFGATPTRRRTVVDGNVVTGGGVTAGIDFALQLAAQMFGSDIAQTIQLSVEYEPEPPFRSGHPDTAPAPLTAAYLRRIAARQDERRSQVKLAAAALEARGSVMTAVPNNGSLAPPQVSVRRP